MDMNREYWREARARIKRANKQRDQRIERARLLANREARAKISNGIKRAHDKRAQERKNTAVWDHVYNHFAYHDPSCKYCQERPETREKKRARANSQQPDPLVQWFDILPYDNSGPTEKHGQTAKGDQ